MMKYVSSSVLLILPALIFASDLSKDKSQASRDETTRKLSEELTGLPGPILEGESHFPNAFQKGAYFSPCGLVYVCLVTHNVRPFNPYGDLQDCPWKQWDLYCHYAYCVDGVLKKAKSTSPVMSANTSNGSIYMHEYDNKGFGCVRMGDTVCVSGKMLYGPIFDLKQEPEKKSFSFIYRPSSFRDSGVRCIYYLDGREEQIPVENVINYLKNQSNQ